MNANGSMAGSNFSISSGVGHHRENPAVAYKPAANEYLVAWEYEYSAADHDVYCRRVASDTTLPDSETPVSTLGSLESHPAVASDASRAYLVVWEDGRDSATQGINLYGDLVTVPMPTLTDTPTSTATRTPTRTATHTSTPTPTTRPTYTSTPSPTPMTTLPPDCPDLLLNGDFESGVLAPWQSSGLVALRPGRSGAYGTWMLAQGAAGAQLWQEISLPAQANPARIDFWWLAENSVEQPQDQLIFYAIEEGAAHQLLVMRATSPLGQWRHETVDLTAYAGRLRQIQFTTYGDAEYVTTFRLDDVHLFACGVPTPTATLSPTLTHTTTPTRTSLPTSTATLGAVVNLTLCAMADTYVDEYAPNTNFGSASDMLVGFGHAPGERFARRALVRFDLSFIPPGSQIQSASFQALHLGGSGTEVVTLTLHAVQATWDEIAVTWANQPDILSGAVARTQVPARTSGNVFSWNVRDLVQRWVNGDMSNWGLELRGPEETGTYWVRPFSSRHYTAFCPRLELAILPSGPMPTPTATSTATATPTPTVTPVNFTLCAMADAYIEQGAADSNMGNYPDLRVAFSTGPDPFHDRALVRFDLSNMPTTAIVKSAWFQAYLNAASGSLAQVNMEVYQVTNAWTEGGVTWSNQPSVKPSLISSSTLGKVLGYKSWNVKDLVQGWINGSIPNYGLELRGPETSGWSRTFSSREGTYCPQLVLSLESSVPINTPTPVPTATPTATPTLVPTPVTRQVYITGVEVTQAIQDLSNSVPLIAGKKTVVRVHLKVLDGKGDLSDVHGYLYYPYSGYGPVFSPINPGGVVTARANPDRGQLNHTLNFVIPGQYATGAGLLFVRVLPPGGATFPGIGELQDSRWLSFGDVPAMRLRLVGMRYTINNISYEPRNLDFANVESWLRAAYPIGSLISSRTTTTYTQTQGLPNCCTVDQQLATIKTLDVVNKTATTDTRYYGLVFEGPPANYFMVGCVCGFGTLSGPTGADTWGWDFDGSYGDWYAGHELGHQYALCHPGFCSDQEGQPDTAPHCTPYPYPKGYIGGPASDPKRFYGLNIETLAVYTPTWTDMMSYCNYQWISDFHYKRIRNKMISPLAFSLVQADPQERLLVVGTVDLATDAVALDSFLRVPGAEDAVERVPGEYSIVLVDRSGTRLAEYPFTPRVQDHAEQQLPGAAYASTVAGSLPTEVGHIFEFVPWRAETARVGIWHEQRELTGRNVSPNPPTVRIVYPNGGEVLTGESFTVHWSAADADGDSLTFTTLYSTDGGESWLTLATGIRETSYAVDTKWLAGSKAALIRVLASDGVNTTSDQSDATFALQGRGPQASILQPSDGAHFSPDDIIVLAGGAYDPEDGNLDDLALIWESDRDGQLGNGGLLTLAAQNLTPGLHQITLKATDSDGMVGSASVSIFVGQRLYLPLIMKSYRP